MSDHPLKSEKLSLTTKLAYGTGTSLDMWGNWLFPSVAYAVFNIYLGLSPTLVGLALTIIRLYDAFSDPIFGWLSDNNRSKWGRRRPFILIAGTFVGIGLPLLFLVPESAREAELFGVSGLFWYMIGVNAVFIPIVSAANVPYQSLGNEMSPDYNERTSVMAFKNGLQKVFEIGFFVALPFTNLAIFTMDNGEQDVLKGIFTYACMLGSFMVLASFTVFFKVKERYYEKASRQKKTSITDSIYKTLKCAPFRWQLIYGMAFVLGTSMVSSLGYYATIYHVCAGDSIAGNNWNGLMGIAYMVGGLLGVPFAGLVASRFGKKGGAAAVAGVGICIYLGTWYLYSPAVPWLQLIASGGIAFCASGLWTMHAAIGADVIDYDELKTGIRREGAFSASGTYLLKLGNSLGYFLAGLVLQSTGFDSSLEIQNPESIFAIRFFLAAIPILGLIVVLFAVAKYPITRAKAEQNRVELENRRGTV